MRDHVEVAGVRISRPDKQLYPGISKVDIARYYADIAEWMLPHLADRPVNQQRWPDGIEQQGFYEKKVAAHVPDWVDRVRVDTADGPQDQIMINSVRTLVYLADQACLTPHTWLSTADALDRPDRMIFDLDPSRDDLAAVRAATRMTGELLGRLGLTAFCTTTGSRGYHVVVPLRPEAGFDTVREAARRIADRLATEHPDELTTEQRKDKRGDRVFVDMLRNAYGQTAVPPYALRGRLGAPIATPIEWDELGRVAPDHYDLDAVRRRLAQRDDPWHRLRQHAHSPGRLLDRLAS